MKVLSIIIMTAFISPWPSDLLIKFQFYAGTMPPPYHYEYQFQVNSKGLGDITFYPNYTGMDSVPEWKENFKVDQSSMQAFWNLVDSSNCMKKKWTEPKDTPIGGSVEYLSITANDKTVDIPPFATNDELAESLRNAAKKLLPAHIMQKFMDMRQQYMDQYLKQKE